MYQDILVRPGIDQDNLGNNKDEDGYENVTLRATSRLFHLVPFVKCWQIFVELVPKGQYRISEKQGSRCPVVRPPQEAVV